MNENFSTYLEEKGWSQSGQWWLPPLNAPKGHYKQKCYGQKQAIKREAELRGLTLEQLISRHREWIS